MWFKEAKTKKELSKAYDAYLSFYEEMRNKEQLTLEKYDKITQEAWAGYETRLKELEYEVVQA